MARPRLFLASRLFRSSRGRCERKDLTRLGTLFSNEAIFGAPLPEYTRGRCEREDLAGCGRLEGALLRGDAELRRGALALVRPDLSKGGL